MSINWDEFTPVDSAIRKAKSEVDWAQFTPIKPPSGVIDTLISGGKQTARSLGANVDLAQGDNDELTASARAQAAERKDPRMEAFLSQIADWKKVQQESGADPSLWETAKELGSAAASNPVGAALMVVEQLPNSFVALGSGAAGAAAGSVIGGPVGAIIGGIGGMFAANAGLETGGKALEAAQKGPLSDEQRADVAKEGLVKGGVITGIDVGTLGITKAITGAARRAVDAATVRALSDAGVDAATIRTMQAGGKEAQEAVARFSQANPLVASEVLAAQEAAYTGATTLGKRALRGGMAAGLETFGEGLGEYLGEYAATGQADKMDALIEAFSSMGQSAAEIAATGLLNRNQRETSAWKPVEPGTPPTQALPPPVYGMPEGTSMESMRAAQDAADRAAAAEQANTELWRERNNEEARANEAFQALGMARTMDEALAAADEALEPSGTRGLITRAMERQREAEARNQPELQAIAEQERRDQAFAAIERDREIAKLIQAEAARRELEAKSDQERRQILLDTRNRQGDAEIARASVATAPADTPMAQALRVAVERTPLESMPTPQLRLVARMAQDPERRTAAEVEIQRRAGTPAAVPVAPIGLLATQAASAPVQSVSPVSAAPAAQSVTPPSVANAPAQSPVQAAMPASSPTMGQPAPGAQVAPTAAQPAEAPEELPVFKDLISARQAAKKLTRAGQKHVAIKHPTKRGKFTIEPVQQKPVTEKQLAARAAAAERLRAGRRADPTRQSLNAWLAARGGLSLSERNDTITEGNKQYGSNWLFRGNGQAMDMAAEAAYTDGFLSEEEYADGGGVEALRRKIAEEYAGQREHYSTQNADIERAKAEAAAEADLMGQADRLGIPTDGLTIEQIDEAVRQRLNTERELVEQEAKAEAEKERQAIQDESLVPEDNFNDDDIPGFDEEQSLDESALAAALGDEDFGQQAIGGNEAGMAADQGQPAEGNRNPDAKRPDQGGQEGGQASGEVDRPALDLAAQSPEDLAEKSKAEQAAAEAEAKASADREAADRLERERKEVKARSEAAAGTFELGQSAEDNLSGQGGLFAGAPSAAKTVDQMSPADLLRAAADKLEGKVPEQAPAEAKPANTEDSGAELSYNRRNRIRSGIKWEDIANKNDTLRVSETTKANVYPRPDYETMVNDGMQPVIAHLVKQVYDAISAKPATSRVPTDADLQQYIEGVNRVMDGVLAWANDKQAISKWAQSQARVAGAELGRPTSITEMAEPTKSLMERVYPNGWRENRQEVMLLGGNKLMGALQPDYTEARRAVKAVGDGWPAKQEAWQKSFVVEEMEVRANDVPESEQNGEPQKRFFVKEKSRKWRMAKGHQDGGYATNQEAVEFARTLTKRENKTSISEKGISVQDAEREGADHRMEGEDISSDKLRDTFGFKGVNFGTWMKGDSNKAERQLHLNHAYDSFMDLADILGVPPKAMSLNGMLGVAIGAQGNGKYAAHFVPGLNEINLTRTSGAGSLAHEFAHAVDHYFAVQAGLAKRETPFLTEHGQSATNGLRPEIAESFQAIVQAMNKKQESPEQMAARIDASREKTKRSINGWLASIKRDFMANKVDEAQFDAIAERIRNLDLGDGKVFAGTLRQGGINLSTAVDELRQLYKKTVGRVYSLDQIKGLQYNLDSAIYANSVKAAAQVHVPQQVSTEYAKNAMGLDQKKKGKPYWSTNLEKFARAFDAFVSDTLEAKAAKNTYLSHAGRSDVTTPVGEERAVINKAIGNLISAIKTKETDSGVAMFSRGRRNKRSISVEDAKAHWNNLTAGFKNLPKVSFLKSTSQAPESLLSQIKSARAEDTAMGAYHQGKVYIFADNIPDLDSMERFVAQHELRHYGMEGKYGNQLRAALLNLRELNPELKAAADALKEQYKDLDDSGAVNEVLANAPLDYAQKLNGWKRFKMTMRAWLNAHGYKRLAKLFDNAATADELTRDFLYQAEAFYKGKAKSETTHLYETNFGRNNTPSATSSEASDGNMTAKTDQTDTPAFKKWFGDSKVVDENGKPLVVYHGTITWEKDGKKLGDIEAFDRMASVNIVGRKASIDTVGSWFSTNPSSDGGAGMYGDAIYPVYLSINDPHETTFNLMLRRARKLANGKDDGRVIGAAEVEAYRAWLKEIGKDGIHIVHDDGSESSEFSQQDAWIALEPEQIKSAIGNSGTFDPENPDVRFSRSGQANPASWNVDQPGRMDRFIRVMQDRHIDTKKVLAAIRSQIGNVGDAVNVYLKEELFHGRAAKRTQDFLDDEMRPLLTDMAARGISMTDFEEFLHARHAEERNIQIAKINPDMPDGGSGMDTADARAYLAKLTPQRRRAFDALAKRVDAINQGTRRLLVSYGLESADAIQAWESTYQHYVPLQREDMEGGMGTGQGFSVRGTQKRATGSKRDVVDILANIAMQRERAIVRGEKNRVANALVGLATMNPNKDFWKVDQPPMLTRVDDRTGLVVKYVDPLYKSRDNVVMSRLPNAAGEIEEHAVVFNERNERAMRMAAALKNLDVDELGQVLGLTAKVTRWFSSINTQYNPIFGVVNLVRDTQGAMLNLSTTPLAGKEKEVLSHTLSALRGIYIDAREVRKGNHPRSAWAQLFEEFQREGGQTGFRDMFRTSKDRAEAIERELKRISEGKVERAGRAVFDWLSDYNLAMENAVRLSAYKEAKNAGMSNQQAASLAKNVTVNFNRKGEAATQAGALYAFFNASAQGTARLAETMKGPMGKKIIMGGLLLGTIQALMLAAAGFDEEEPPDFVRERSIIIPIGGKKYVTIPMPLGFHVIPNISRVATEFALSGFRDPGKRAAELIGLMFDTFNPVGSAGLSLQTIAPTVVDPLAALAENRDWTGKPIAREDLNKLAPTPAHTRAKDTASWFGMGISKAMNWATGGTNYKPGLFAMTPDQVDYLVGQVTGGVGREALKVDQTITSMFTGEDLAPHKMPLVGRFYGDAEGQSAQGNKFYTNLRLLNEHEAELKGRRKAGEPVAEYLAANPEARLWQMANRAEREVRELRAQRRKMIAADAERDRIKAINERITATMKRFNDRVGALRDQ